LRSKHRASIERFAVVRLEQILGSGAYDRRVAEPAGVLRALVGDDACSP
jgi:hypothetical protein